MSRTASGALASVYKYIRICYRGGSCGLGYGAGVWAVYLGGDVSGSYRDHDLRLK